jgi:S1-C subfamily serine protease
MWLRKADLIGLAIGFSLGAGLLAGNLRHLEAAFRPRPPPHHVQLRPVDADDPPPVVRQPPAPPAASQSAPPDQIAALAPPPLPSPAALPRILAPERPPDGGAMPPLPNVIEPSPPRQGAGMAGTGFFIANDGSLLTAAHVVADCRRTEILSRLVKPTAADILASDAKQDIALLRAHHLRPPGLLPLGRPVSSRMVVFGYPDSAGPIVPQETTATLENDKFPKPLTPLTDPRDMVWIAAEAVTHGYSGGPILNPDSGAVVGIVKGMVDTARLNFVRDLPKSGMAVGPGAGRLAAFLNGAAPGLDVAAPSETGDTVLNDARRATVHVICWY